MEEQKILDYLKGVATPEQEELVEQWILDSEENSKRFYQIKAAYAASGFDETAQTVDMDKGYIRFKRAVYSRKRASYRRLSPYLKYAAAVLFLVGISFLFQQGFFNDDAPNLLVPPEETITLELEDGSIQIINPEDSKEVRDAQGNVMGNQQKTQLIYTGESTPEALVHNTLTVPYGKRFDVVLSDGTIIYMNAGTELKYPISFLSEGNREVYVSGEAYFDVAPDTERPFIVNAETLDIEVLGTEFNVQAYPEDKLSDVVLVEGSVAMYANEGHKENVTVLTPGNKGSFDRSDSEIVTEKVNVRVYTSWRNGELVYRNIPFKHMLKKLERHYNIKMVLDNSVLGEELFSASFDRKSIEDVLKSFDEVYSIEYTITNNMVIIK